MQSDHSSFQHVLYPNSVNVAVFTSQIECAKALYRVILEATAKFIAVHHEQRAEALFFILVKFALVVFPIIFIAEVEVVVIRVFTSVSGALVIKDSESMKGIALPTAGIA